MPHVLIQHFKPALPQDALERLSNSVATLLHDTFGCADSAISIAVKPVEPSEWTEQVYEPVIAADACWLVKTPGYGQLTETDI